MPPDDISALRDIADACGRIHSVAAVLRREEFEVDWVVTSACERQLTVIGEAVKRLTPEFRSSHGEVDWRGWAGLRDVLVHAYDQVEVPQVWDIVSIDVPQLIEFLSRFTLEPPA